MRLGPGWAADDTHPVVDADVLMGAPDKALWRRDHTRVHAQEVLDGGLLSGLLGDFSDHGVEGVLTVLDAATRQRPGRGAGRRAMQGEQHSPVCDAHGVRRQTEAHAVTTGSGRNGIAENGGVDGSAIRRSRAPW